MYHSLLNIENIGDICKELLVHHGILQAGAYVFALPLVGSVALKFSARDPALGQHYVEYILSRNKF